MQKRLALSSLMVAFSVAFFGTSEAATRLPVAESFVDTPLASGTLRVLDAEKKFGDLNQDIV